MALTYYLKFKRKVEKKKEISDLIKKNKSNFFLISDLYNTKYGFINGNFDGTIINIDLGEISEISLDIIDKEAEPILLRNSILDIVYTIVNEIYPDEDYYFDLNGDYIFEKRENGVVKRNNNTNFYNGLD
jgi:uncharacterized protein YqfB (UPF0267 family)